MDNNEVEKKKAGRKKATICTVCSVENNGEVKFRNGKCINCFNKIQNENYYNKHKDYHKNRYLEKSKDKVTRRNKKEVDLIDEQDSTEENENIIKGVQELSDNVIKETRLDLITLSFMLGYMLAYEKKL